SRSTWRTSRRACARQGCEAGSRGPHGRPRMRRRRAEPALAAALLDGLPALLRAGKEGWILLRGGQRLGGGKHVELAVDDLPQHGVGHDLLAGADSRGTVAGKLRLVAIGVLDEGGAVLAAGEQVSAAVEILLELERALLRLAVDKISDSVVALQHRI